MFTMIRAAFLGLALLALASPALAEPQYPEVLSKVVAAYPGSKVLAVQKEQMAVQAVLTSEDEPQKIVAHYRNELTGKGWETTEEIAMGPIESIVFRKDDQRLTFSVTDNAEEKQRLVTVALEHE